MRGVSAFTINAAKADDAVLATFISGAPSEHAAAGLEFAASPANDDRPHGRIVADTPRVTFEGDLAKPSAAAGSRLLVGAYNRSTGELQLLQLGWQCGLEPRVKARPSGSDVDGSAVALDAPGGGAAGAMGTPSAPLRKRELVEEFGSKKARKKQKAEALRVVDVDRMAERGALEADLLLAGAGQAASLEADAAAAAAAPLERPHLPPHALGADDPIESYPLDAIAPPALWAELPHGELLAHVRAVGTDAELAGACAAVAAAAAAAAAAGAPPVEARVMAHAGAVEMGTLRRARDEARTDAPAPPRLVAELRALLFVRHLIAFASLPPSIRPPHRRRGADGADGGGGGGAGGGGGGEEGGPHPLAVQARIPERVWTHLLARFTERVHDEDGRSSHRRTDACADRLACHALALLLRMSRNALRVDAAAEALKLPRTKVTLYLRELGCTVGATCPLHAPAGTQVAGARYAELRMPLTFPAIKAKVQRAGR